MTSETPKICRQRRRRYDAAFKQAIVEQTLQSGASVARIAREHGINANQVFKWRRQFLLAEGASALPAQTPPAISLLPVTVVADEPASSAASASASAAQQGQIEIQLAGGTVRIQGAVDPTMLGLVLSSLRR